MKYFLRNDTGILARWWWSVDRISLFSLLFLIIIGNILIIAASPAVAERIGLSSYHFIIKQFIYLLPSLFLLFLSSLLSASQIKKAGYILFILSFICLCLVPFLGQEIKGAKRWLSFFGFSFQPSEFIKPAFAIISGRLISLQVNKINMKGKFYTFFLYVIVLSVLLLQPDIGMSFIISGIWVSQIFVAGLPLQWILCIVSAAIFILMMTYYIFPHASQRIDQFLHPTQLSYQVEKSLEAFKKGGLLGRGPGEGRVKEILPDGHADFIFAVAGEEFGALPCFIILFLFLFIIMRSIFSLFKQNNSFIIIAATGLIIQFGLQILVNIGSTLHLIPTKGMTLPFVSYGGSSLIALAISFGFLLGLTRDRGDFGEKFLKKSVRL